MDADLTVADGSYHGGNVNATFLVGGMAWSALLQQQLIVSTPISTGAFKIALDPNHTTPTYEDDDEDNLCRPMPAYARLLRDHVGQCAHAYGVADNEGFPQDDVEPLSC